MSSKTDRRRFLCTGTAATAGVLTAGGLRIAQGQEKNAHEDHGSQHERQPAGEFPRTQPGPGGPLGSATDRGKLVSGYRSPSDPHVPVVMPDLDTLPWKIVDGVKE